MDKRCVVWCHDDGEWVRATSRVFSCHPEARGYADTLDRERSPVIIPFMLEKAIVGDWADRYRRQEHGATHH